MSKYVNVQDIAAIPTEYMGTVFRSRLEARWAKVFSMLNIKWEYEPKCFQTDCGDSLVTYLPDFYLPDFDIWVEVKGTQNNLNADWDSKMKWVMDFSDSPIHNTWGTSSGLLILGQIPTYFYDEGKIPVFTFIQHSKGLLHNRAVFDVVNGCFTVEKCEVDYKHFFDYPRLENTLIEYVGVLGEWESVVMERVFITASKWNF